MTKNTKSEVGRIGALARIKKYGNLGTPEGRKKGGINSIKRHIQLNGNFKIAKDHLKPRICSDLAEFMGIMIGDGHLSNYQVLFTTNSETDIEHALYVKNLIKKLFNLDASLKKKNSSKAVNVVVSSVNLVKWLENKGMPIGNKLDCGLPVPHWVYKNLTLQSAFIRGLFDTDGCIYTDKHTIKNKVYYNQGWALTSYSEELKCDIIKILKNLKFSPTARDTQRSVYMRKKIDIHRYFKEIGTSNSKHLKRYNWKGTKEA